MQDLNFVTLSTRFKCKRCTKCCHLDVQLNDIEMETLREFADKKWRTTRKVFRENGLVCCLLDHISCTIYEKRPELCRMYPFSSVLESDLTKLGIKADNFAIRISGPDGQRYLIIYDEECPGIGKGNLFDRKQIFQTQ